MPFGNFFVFLLNMGKTVKSAVRQILFTMISKYQEKQNEQRAIIKQKDDCLHVVKDFVENNSSIEGATVALANLKKIKDIHEEEYLSQNKYFEKISSMTEISISTLKRIYNESKGNKGVFSTPGKKRPHKKTVSNLDSFDIQAIRNKINEYYIVKKQVPTLRSLLTDLKESIGFTGCRETLRQILLTNGFEFKQNKNQRSVLVERYDIAAWRHRFLRTIATKRQAEIQNWLRCNDISFEESQSREKLLCLVNKHKPEPIFEADQILKEHGHEVIRLPPYHCDLNPIEIIWSTAKRKVASKNISRSLSEMENLIKECFDSITSEEWKTMVNHTIRIEEKYKEKDGIVAEIESFIINVTESGDESSDTDSEELMEGVEYLESDFDYSE